MGTPLVTTTPAGYGPADLRSAYALPSATAGAGRTVAIVDAYDDPSAEMEATTARPGSARRRASEPSDRRSVRTGSVRTGSVRT